MKNFTLCVLLFCAQLIQAQMSVTTVETPAELVQNVLVGEGVTPFNITFNGAPATAVRLQAGHFTTNFNPTNLGITEGMILSTGNSRDAPGPNNAAGHTSTGGNIQINDVDLDILTTNTVTNVTVVEFDFVATGLELNFDYIFASEEYPEYVFDPGGYNDVFGFFLRGPGITGPFTGNAKNLAVVPNTTTPITVNTINNGHLNTGIGAVNPGLYNPNSVTPTNGTTWTGHTVQYDGFTDVLRATAALICGETYHIKLAIANCGDQGWDSAVFLKNFRIKPLELMGNNSGSGMPVCPGLAVDIESGIIDQGFIYEWTQDGTVIPGATGPDHTIPPVAAPVIIAATALVAGERYQIVSVGTSDFTLAGATTNALSHIFTATGSTTGDGFVVPVSKIELKYTTATGCLLGTASFDLTYFAYPLKEPQSFEKCFPLSATDTYSFDEFNLETVSNYILNGASPGAYDIRIFHTLAEAEAPIPGAGISLTELQNYTTSSLGDTLYIRCEDLTFSSCVFVKPFTLTVSVDPQGSFSYGGPYCLSTSSATVAPTIDPVNGLTPGGTFNSSSASLVINPANGEIDLALSSPGLYTVTYYIPPSSATPPPVTVPPSTNCGGFTVVKPVELITAMPAPVVTDITYCQGESALPLSVAGPGIVWYDLPVGGTGTTLAPTPLTNATGVTSYYVSQNGGCESPRAEIKVDVKPKPLPPGVSPVTYCQNDTPGLLTATGTNLLWYNSLTGGTGSATPPAVSTVTPGVTTHFVSQTSADGCESDRAQFTVTVNPLPVAPSGPLPTQPTCTVPTGTIIINAPVGANYEYSIDNGINYQPQTTFALLAPNASYSIIVRNTVTGCVSAATVYNIQPAPTFPAVPAVAGSNVCAGGQIDLTTPAVAGATYSWTGPNGFTSSVQNPSIPNSTLAMSGVYSLIISTGPDCPSNPGTVNIVVNPLPAMPGVSPVAYCQNDTPNVLTATGTNLLWYNSLTSATGSTTPPAVSTGTPGVTTYYVSQTSATGCESDRAQLVVTVNALPSAPSGNVTQPTCTAPTGKIEITSPVGANFEYSIDNGASYQPQTTFALLAPNASYYIIVRNTLTQCVSASTRFDVNIAPTFPATPAVAASDVCIGEQIDLTTPAVAGATYSWTGPNGFTSSVQNPSIPNSTLAMSGTYSLVISTGADCPSNPGTVNIVVNPLPQPSLPQDAYICFNALTNVGSPYVLNSGLDNATYDFEWFNSTGGTYAPISGETQNTYTVSTPGAYAVRATNVVTGCVSPMVTANVGMSSPPLHVVAVSAEYFADIQSITINVSPPGNYEYQLDNGAFQTGNMFSNLLPGTHTVTVRNECGELSTSAYLMDYPRFFTPNGDGYNDTWNIFALNTQAMAKIYIFDRYGKLIKQISPGGKGWDGTLNEQILPSTDYWFTVEYEENSVRKEFKSHFALKR